MKKYILTFFVYFFFQNIAFGNFLSDPTDLNLYKKIDSGYYDLELKYLEKELKGGDVGGSISQDLNSRADFQGYEECFEKELTAQDISKIYHDNNGLEILQSTLKPCFGENIAIDTLLKYQAIIDESYKENKKKAQNKVDNIYKIGRIGMYSDGVSENSPFDLMVDLNEINDIIFEKDIPYNGVNNYDIGRNVDGILSGLTPSEAFSSSKYDYSIEQGSSFTAPEEEANIQITDEICLIENNNSGLNDNFFKQILGSQKNGNNNQSSELSSGENTNNNLLAKTGYKKVNDNDMWPCNNFFCIMIDFVIYNHQLLGGSKNLSIEGLIKRSNTHLKKFAGTSLIQSKMTTNNFEIGLKDLNLPDIFHVGVQVSYKPVPLYNVDKKEKDLADEQFTSSHLFEEYYKALGLDYKRSNDLNLYLEKESEYKSLLDSQELHTGMASEKYDDFQKYKQENAKKIDYISNQIVEKKVIEDDIEGFYRKFLELEVFSRALMEYTFGLKGMIQEMNKIPQGG